MEHTTLSSVYADLAASSAAFASATALACPSGCGMCCRRPSREIESSVFELKDLARDLVVRGLGMDTLHAARAAGAEGTCVLYRRGEDGPDRPGGGSCGEYGHRPLVCRLFGFTGTMDRTGAIRFQACRVMRERHPLPVAAAVAVVATPEADTPMVPVSTWWRARVASLDPDPTHGLIPLNEALARALEGELTRSFYADRDSA